MKFIPSAGAALLLFLTVFLGLSCPLLLKRPVLATTITELELVSWAFVTPSHGDIFDFSGLEVMPDGTFLLLDDDKEKIFSFSGKIADSIKINELIDLGSCLPKRKTTLDLESIRRYQSHTVLLANEAENQVIEWDLEKRKARILADLSTVTLDSLGFTSTHGLEALCPYETDLIMVKETPPLSIVLVSLPEGKVKKVYKLKADSNFIDITDCIYADSTLFLLHRGGWRIMLTEPRGDRFILYEVWDFSSIKEQPRFDYIIRDPTTGNIRNDWGVAEALAMDEKYIYVGLDNNGEPLRSNPQERRATLLVFKRPGDTK